MSRKMSKGLDLRKCASFAISDRKQQMAGQSQSDKQCKELQENYIRKCMEIQKNCETQCQEMKEQCEKQCKELKEHFNRERTEMEKLIKELLKRNNDQRNDLPGTIEAQEWSSCFDQPCKVVTSSFASKKGPGNVNLGFSRTVECSKQNNQTSENSRNSHLLDMSFGKILRFISIHICNIKLFSSF